jgi:RecA/RadA recombinase
MAVLNGKMEPKEPTCDTAAELYKRSGEVSLLSFGDSVLDISLGGGIPLHGIHEICGEAGSGKTQMALQLAVRGVLPVACGGLGGQSCYLTSGEGSFPVKRLQQVHNFRFHL